MVLRKSLLWLIFFVLLSTGGASASSPAADPDWQTIVPGIDYRVYYLPDPNNVFVARMDRNNPNVTLDTSIAEGKLSDGRETVSEMYARYDQALNFWGGSTNPYTWGMRNQVVVAINGSYFDLPNSSTQGGQVQSGWYAKRYAKLGGWGGFTWTLDRNAFISECLNNIPEKQFITVAATGLVVKIDNINAVGGPNKLDLYTPQFDTRTNTDGSKSEIVVEMTKPAMIFPAPRYISGFVREINMGDGNTLIPFNSVVLSIGGAPGRILLENISIGSEIRFNQEISSYDYNCEAPLDLDWTKAYASLQGAFFYLKDGQPRRFDGDYGAVSRQPRTAIALNDQYIYFFVVDGRSYQSVGMTLDELTSFTRDTLGATWGVAQDGGGSSTMVINGQVVNGVGAERAVVNGFLMVSVLPEEYSTTFMPGEAVTAITDADIRLGPGTNYASFTTVQNGQQGLVLPQMNGLNGVLAKSEYWWYVDFSGTHGWVAEGALAGQSARIDIMHWFVLH